MEFIASACESEKQEASFEPERGGPRAGCAESGRVETSRLEASLRLRPDRRRLSNSWTRWPKRAERNAESLFVRESSNLNSIYKERKKERKKRKERFGWSRAHNGTKEQKAGLPMPCHDSKTTLAAVLRTAKVREGERVHRKPTVDRQLQEGLVSAT